MNKEKFKKFFPLQVEHFIISTNFDLEIMNSKEEIFEQTEQYIEGLGFEIVKKDKQRPWGGFLVINENQASKFASQFFPEEDFESLKISEMLSPKILLVAPEKRLSWQYHFRRAEIWRCIKGKVAVGTSMTDVQNEIKTLLEGDKIKLQQGERHRLIGLEDWGVVAEIWQHTDASNPSDEDDIVRLQDDFGR
jgi:mannose-6-phosphate isomerase-like protein (cupin superfamily)